MPVWEDIRLGQLAVAQRLITTARLEECLAIQRSNENEGKHLQLGELLVARGHLNHAQLEQLLDAQRAAAQRVTRIGPYVLLKKLGEGGMGAVYQARDTRQDKLVALKILPRFRSQDDVFLRRFESEVRAVFEVDHPNIVRGLDVGHAEGYHFLVMEYVEGQNVFQLLQKKGRFAEAEALAILVQVAQALSHVHGERLVHRDIKPENILVTPQGVAKLTDLGLAFDRADHGRRRITKVGVTMGTPFYLSPEQITGSGSQDVDIRSDIYSLGVTVYEMVTGQPPFAGEEPTSVLAKHLNEHAPSPRDIDRAISVGFCHILEKMLAKDPKARYQTPAELVEDLRLLKEGQALGSGRPPPGQSTVARPQSEAEPARARRTSGQILKPAPAEPARERPTGAARPSRRRHDGIVAVLNSPWALLVLAAALVGLIVVLTFVLRGRL